MNMPYKTSRDYQLLKKLLDEGKEIVCFTDFPIDKMKTLMLRIYTLPAHENITLPMNLNMIMV